MDGDEEGPDPRDIPAWRKVIERRSLPTIRGQSIVAAAQTIGPNGDQRILRALMMEISERILRILRKLIGRHHRNGGRDMIEEAHGKLIEAVLTPRSADGQALRIAFVATVRHRGADAIRAEQLHSKRFDYAVDEDALPLRQDQMVLADEERAHVESVLKRISDPRKRLAFRLHLDGVPRHSTRVASIASALGVSAKTIETWIRDTEEEIKAILGVKP